MKQSDNEHDIYIWNAFNCRGDLQLRTKNKFAIITTKYTALELKQSKHSVTKYKPKFNNGWKNLYIQFTQYLAKFTSSFMFFYIFYCPKGCKLAYYLFIFHFKFSAVWGIFVKIWACEIIMNHDFLVSWKTFIYET